MVVEEVQENVAEIQLEAVLHTITYAYHTCLVPEVQCAMATAQEEQADLP